MVESSIFNSDIWKALLSYIGTDIYFVMNTSKNVLARHEGFVDLVFHLREHHKSNPTQSMQNRFLDTFRNSLNDKDTDPSDILSG